VRGRLIYKLLLVNIPVIAVVPVVVWVAVDYLAADYFMTLMDRYHVNPLETHHMFLHAIHRYILWAGGAGLALAVGLSFVLTRQVLKPLAEVAGGARRISRGDYGARVRGLTRDEVGELATAFNAMADSLERIETLRKTMVADVAHELRTPLTNVRGYLEALRDGVVPPSPQTYTMLEDEVLRLVRLVDDLAQLTRADAARHLLRLEPVDVARLVDEACGLFTPPLREKGVSLERRVAEGIRPLQADRARLLQVLRNLLDNAVRHTPEGGTVTVSAAPEGASVRLEVANTGPPIPPAELPLIFERFYRVDKSRSRASGGAGIGLAIVKQLVEVHGGTVGAESGGGTTRFWVTLPA
jgi:two-component system sensor histidine kinase BaeS